MMKINVEELESGMVTADNVVEPGTDRILLLKDTVLDSVMIFNLKERYNVNDVWIKTAFSASTVAEEMRAEINIHQSLSTLKSVFGSDEDKPITEFTKESSQQITNVANDLITSLYADDNILLKSAIVLSSWLFGYFGMKHLPLTIVGPINATRPVMVLVGALLVFGERLNLYQWIGVWLAVVSFLLLSHTGKKEGIDFRHNRWIVCTLLAAMLGAISGLYDKYLMASPADGGVGLDRMLVQSWYNIYQTLMMAAMLVILWWPAHHRTTPFRWTWSIPLVSIFLSTADVLYFYSLSLPGALISVVSMVRRSSVAVSFLIGAWFFHEKNLRSKALDLALVLLGMLFLYLGSR